jgi:hypothetical protein
MTNMVGKSLKPRCFKNIIKLPEIHEYYTNTKAWYLSTELYGVIPHKP